jgi:MFS family permease
MKITTSALSGVLRETSFRNFWIGFTLSGSGDAMTKTALVWFVYDTTRSAPKVGLLLLAYAGPVAIGGLLAGYLLDRFDRRLIMLADSVIRGLVVGTVPIAYATGHLQLWHLYAVAAVYGFLFMISLAGAPTLIPSLVRDDQLTAANSLETLAFTVSGVAGPAIAGFLIVGIGAPYVLAIDAGTYFIFAFALATMRMHSEPEHVTQAARQYRIIDAVRLLLGNRVLRSTTIMFMAFNAGEGFLHVWLPIHSTAIDAAHGAQLYGVLLTTFAVGETVGALSAGSMSSSLSVGKLICIAQTMAGLGLALALVGQTVWSTAPALFLLGFFSAPMTAWAQTLRMRIIPPELRGRSFALLRTLMQAGYPAFSGIGGFLLPVVGLSAMIGLSVSLVGVPGLVGLRIRELITAGKPEPADKPADKPADEPAGKPGPAGKPADETADEPA